MGWQKGDGLGMWRGDFLHVMALKGVKLVCLCLGDLGSWCWGRAAAQAHKTQVDEVGGFSAQVLHHIGNCKLDSRSIRQRMVVFYG